MVLCDGGVFHEDCRVWVAADKGLSVDERDSLIADLEVVVLLVGSFQGIQHVVIHQMIILFQIIQNAHDKLNSDHFFDS